VVGMIQKLKKILFGISVGFMIFFDLLLLVLIGYWFYFEYF